MTRTGATRAVPSIAPSHLRFSAVLVDLGVLLLAMICVMIVVSVAGAISPVAGRIVWPITAVALMGFVVWNLGVRQGRRGASIGKSVVGLRVVDVDTLEPTGAGRGAARCLTHWVDLILAVGVIHAVVDIEDQTLIDRWLRTLVVHP